MNASRLVWVVMHVCRRASQSQLVFFLKGNVQCCCQTACMWVAFVVELMTGLFGAWRAKGLTGLKCTSLARPFSPMIEIAWSMPPDSVPTYFSHFAVNSAMRCAQARPPQTCQMHVA